MTAVLLTTAAGIAPVQMAHAEGAATQLQAASDGGRSFSPQVGSRESVNVRALAARGATEAPNSAIVPYHTRIRPAGSSSTPLAIHPQVVGPPPAVQATITSKAAAAQPGFQGLAFASGPSTERDPPDPWVAAGPDHIVQVVNTSLRITDRSGSSAAPDVSLADFFGISGLPVTVFNSDPRITYDSLHGRWIATEVEWDCDTSNVSFGHGYIDVRVSQTSDPTSTWSGFYFVWNDRLPDYPGLGTSSDKVALSANVFAMLGGGNCVSALNYVGTDTIVIDWAEVLNPTTLPFDEYALGADYFTPRVAVQSPATSAPLRMVVQKLVFGSLDVDYVLFTGLVGSGGGTSGTEVDLTAASLIQAFLDPVAPRQPAGLVAADLDSRPTDAVWQNNTLTFVSTQGCTPTGDTLVRDCVRVSQLNTSTPTPSVAQDFLIAQNGEDSYMGGIGVSANSGLFVAWTQSSATAGHYPSSYAAYHLPTDVPNSISPPELIAAGQANHIGGRWGDYVGVAQDPQDPNAVWQGNQYASSDGVWGTFVSQLKTDASGATLVPLPPARLLDTRVGNGLAGPFSSGVPRTFQVSGRGGVPAGAVAVTGNLTVTEQTQAGFVYLGPDPVASPTSSTLNFPLADNRANGVTVALSLAGSLSATYVAVGGGSSQLVFDVTGYFVN